MTYSEEMTPHEEQTLQLLLWIQATLGPLLLLLPPLEIPRVVEGLVSVNC